MPQQYKIETYTGAVLDHTITTEAHALSATENLTARVGFFDFAVNTKNGLFFSDIALNDKVKFYFWDSSKESCPTTPNFVGKIGSISGSVDLDEGTLKVFSGLSQGNVLHDRTKSNKFYDDVHADTIATDVATDLSLGTSFSGDASDDYHVTLEISTMTYFEILQYISDYYTGAGSVLKDFYVDVGDVGHPDGHLVWKTRPFRTAGVETLTVGENISNYTVTRALDEVRNSITVYGYPERPLPTTKDWCETLTNWSASVGSVALDAVDPKVGAQCVKATSAVGGKQCTFKRTFGRITIRDIRKVYFWTLPASITVDIAYAKLYAPDSANYFYADIETGWGLVWTFHSLDLGPSEEYSATANPNGTWLSQGSPNWWDIQAFEIDYTDLNANVVFYLDGLFFFPERWSDATSDAASIAAYGQRDKEVTDERFHSDAECEGRNEAYLYQLKDPPIQIDATIPYIDTNILVGDRLSMTIPSESISASNYDVISVTHSFWEKQPRTQASMVNSANVRDPLARNTNQEVAKIAQKVNCIGQYRKFVR